MLFEYRILKMGNTVEMAGGDIDTTPQMIFSQVLLFKLIQRLAFFSEVTFIITFFGTPFVRHSINFCLYFKSFLN